jgi:hypothetical protein
VGKGHTFLGTVLCTTTTYKVSAGPFHGSAWSTKPETVKGLPNLVKVFRDRAASVRKAVSKNDEAIKSLRKAGFDVSLESRAGAAKHAVSQNGRVLGYMGWRPDVYLVKSGGVRPDSRTVRTAADVVDFYNKFVAWQAERDDQIRQADKANLNPKRRR